MTSLSSSTTQILWVAIDIAKAHNGVLVESPDGRRRHFRMATSLEDFTKLAAFLCSSGPSCRIAFEATGDYHRPLTHFLRVQGFALSLVSSIAVARTRDALFNSWDKNDPKDAQVILHLSKTGAPQVCNDSLASHYHDRREMGNTYQQVSLSKVRLHHSIGARFVAGLPAPVYRKGVPTVCRAFQLHTAQQSVSALFSAENFGTRNAGVRKRGNLSVARVAGWLRRGRSLVLWNEWRIIGIR